MRGVAEQFVGRQLPDLKCNWLVVIAFVNQMDINDVSSEHKYSHGFGYLICLSFPRYGRVVQKCVN